MHRGNDEDTENMISDHWTEEEKTIIKENMNKMQSETLTLASIRVIWFQYW